MTDSQRTDILVLGATGFTGKLIARYLSSHPQKAHFNFALGARSLSRLDTVVKNLKISNDVKLIQVDVMNYEELERAVKSTCVVINTVGPYWTWGTPVVRACARNGVHYVDLTGETHWKKKIIFELDYLATKTGAIIVPSCGFDSIPSDAVVYLANKTLKSLPTNGELRYPALSTSAFKLKGGVSGGTLSTVMTILDDVPTELQKESRRPYTLSPFVGAKIPPFRFLRELVVPGSSTLKGGVFAMASTNRALVQRSFGLFELQATEHKDRESQLGRYGRDLAYDEFLVIPGGVLSALVYTATLIVSFSLLMIKPLRPIIKKFIPAPGEGPSEEVMRNGFFHVTNITTSTSQPPVQVKTVIKAKGDPGYSMTAIMISESALSLLLPPPSQSASIKSSPGQNSNIHALGPIARHGGILTPMTAFGDVLIKRLEDTGEFSFSSSVVADSAGKKAL